MFETVNYVMKYFWNNKLYCEINLEQEIMLQLLKY